MIHTVEAVIDATGRIQLLGDVHVCGPRRVPVTVLDEPAAFRDEATLLAEPALTADWDRPEDDEAWLHLIDSGA